LLDWAADEAALEASANPIATVVLAHLKAQATAHDADARRHWKLRLVKGLYQRGWNADDVRQLFRLLDWPLSLPTELEQQFRQDLDSYEEETHMPYITSVERLAAAEGRAEGRSEGLREGLLSGIELALKLKFKRAGRQLAPEIRQLTDPKKLRALYRAIDKASTLDDVRRFLE
jgi:flagellar biosynthesis/type III secretory pathway protein FliH